MAFGAQAPLVGRGTAHARDERRVANAVGISAFKYMGVVVW